MTRYSDLEYLKLSKGQRFLYKLALFFCSIPTFFKNLGLKILGFFKSLGLSIAKEFKFLTETFKNGSAPTKISYVVMGFGNIARGQVLRGVLFLLFEIVFIGYMILAGGHWLSLLPSLGLKGPTEEYNLIYDSYVVTYNDNSFKILLYGVLTIFFIVAFFTMSNYRINKCARICTS